MDTNPNQMDERFARASADLQVLRQFNGVAKEFWPRFLTVCGMLAQADVAVLLLGKAGQTPRWVKIGEFTAGARKGKVQTDFSDFLEQAAERGAKEGSFVEEDDETSGAYTIGLRLKLLRPEDEVVLVLQVVDFTEAAAQEALVRLALTVDTPAVYQANLASRQAQADVEKFATVLDLMVPVNAENRFLAALLALCNGVATRFQCDRASLGWLEGGYLRIKAISRTEKFDRQMVAAQLLEAAMDECADQEEEVVWPLPDGSTVITRDHEKFTKEQSVGNLCSIPLRVDGKTVAVLTCERQASPFTTTELQQLRLLCDQLTPRLADLSRTDKWFGARIKASLRDTFAKSLGPERTWTKVFAISGALLLAILFFVRVSYRVEGNFILRADAVAYLTAPFEGYIDKVSVRPGDALFKGSEIVSLNRAELLLEQSAAMAEIGRYEREMEKARAAKQLAEMRINEALLRQSKARLDLVNHRLENAVLHAPFDGVIVEGDLRERIASPVKQGEALYKVARLDGLYVEAEVDERDIKEILQSSKAEIAFVTQPKLTFKATVVTIERAALAKKEANVFLVRLKLDDAPEVWWRPGMTGLCKISVEKRTLWWIFTHRTIDFLRMKLWW